VLIVVRHGRTSANAGGLLQGRVDNALDVEGERQAGALAAVLGAVDRVIASPLLRAQQTAGAIAAAAGVTVETDPAWTELAYGAWEERPVRDVPSELWAAWRADPSFRPPDGETLVELQTRVEAACEALRDEAATRDVVVVCHVSPIKAAIAWALGVGPAISWRMNVAQASVHRIRTGPPGQALISFNETHHLT
jgi:probable phosphoglycerate mutase